MTLTSDHATASWITEACTTHGIKHVVISPGSRNGPLTIAFNRHPAMTCHSIADERVAGFFALGIAQQLDAPVALICTSGSAVLNYSPACAEAFYQHVPLLFLSADRPADRIDIGDGQTIRQTGCLEPHVKASRSFDHVEEEQCNAVISGLLSLTNCCAGPVHINMPFKEPLYGTSANVGHTIKYDIHTSTRVDPAKVDSLRRTVGSAGRVMILVGQMKPSSSDAAQLSLFAARTNAVVLSECTSNIDHIPCVGSIDRVLPLATNEDDLPDLLITCGNAIVSKRVKAWLRNADGMDHWHIGKDPKNTFGHLAGSIESNDMSFLSTIDPTTTDRITFKNRWAALDRQAKKLHDEFLAEAPYSDLQVFRVLLDRIPAGSDIQLANSTPVRYAQLFDREGGHRFFCNRGTSGIDGCTSTAAGAAWASGNLTTLITGDVSFLYDSNGLWHHHLSPQLRIIVIDNGGGNIFRFIEGPDSAEEMEQFFETPHRMDVSMIAEAFGLPTYICDDQKGLMEALPKFYADHDRPPVLLIRTEPQVSPKVLRGYFQHLQNG